MAIEHFLASAGMSIAKRAASDGDKDVTVQLPPWVFLTIILTGLVFLPVFLVTGYTLSCVYPTLAIVEDPNPPAYEPVSLSDDVDNPNAAARLGEQRLVTSNIRSINRLLYSVGGWRANFRGLACSLAIGVSKSFVGGLFEALPLIPSFVGTLIATLALVQLYTAWVHIVISPPNPLPFWKRLPPFRKTFEATSIPVAIFWLATLIATSIPYLVATAINLPLWDFRQHNDAPAYDSSLAWKTPLVSIIYLVLILALVIPAHVVLVRVQASLLPPDEDAILPFDRSFGGTIEPAVVDGKGYATWTNALKTFPRSSWVRLYSLLGKVVAITFAVYLVFMSVVLPMVIITGKQSS